MVLTSDKKVPEARTAAQRVQQALSGPTPFAESMTIPEAAVRLSNAAHRLQIAMLREGLDAADGHVGLLFSNVAQGGEQIGVVWAHGSEKVGPLITKLEALESVSILGLVWAVLDREADTGRMWARPLVSGEGVAARMQMARNIFQPPTVIR